VVTAPADPLDEDPLSADVDCGEVVADEPLSDPDVFDAAVSFEAPDVLVALVAPDAAVALLFESAGSRPLTSITAISVQTATNSDRAPAITRRRILRTRAVRAARDWSARSRTACLWELLGVIVLSSFGFTQGQGERRAYQRRERPLRAT
jgi:hypothetical protein